LERNSDEPSSVDYRQDFQQALGEEFGEAISPPVPFEDANPHDCCEVLCTVLGEHVTPARLAAVIDSEITEIARQFGEFFECVPPSPHKIRLAIIKTLARWPNGS
jgi:hypothetical protein